MAAVEDARHDEGQGCHKVRPAAPGIDWNGVDWNGVDWNGVDWNGVDWNGVDWNGVDWNGVDWKNVDIDSVLGASGGERTVHPDARPLFFFVHATSNGTSFPLAIPSPGSLRMIASAPKKEAAAYFLKKSFEIAYGPGFRALVGDFDMNGDGEVEPVVAEGRLGLAPSLVGLGPYDEHQVMAWTSMIGNLINVQPFQLSLRAYDVHVLAATDAELSKYMTTDLRGAIGRLMPPPHQPETAPVMILLRDRMYWVSMDTNGTELQDQLDQRRACPMPAGATYGTCYDGAVYVVDLLAATREGTARCDEKVGAGAYTGTVPGRCWVNLPGLQFEQDTLLAPITASFVDSREICSACGSGGGGMLGGGGGGGDAGGDDSGGGLPSPP